MDPVGKVEYRIDVDKWFAEFYTDDMWNLREITAEEVSACLAQMESAQSGPSFCWDNYRDGWIYFFTRSAIPS